MWHTKRILVITGSPESEWARQTAHRLALDTLRQLPAAERWEVVFLDVLLTGEFEFPEHLSEMGSRTGDTFSKFEALELLRSIRLDFASPLVTCHAGKNIAWQLIQELKLRPIVPARGALSASQERSMISQASIFHRLGRMDRN